MAVTDALFFLRKAAEALLAPMPLFVAAVLGAVLLFRRGRHRTALALWGAAALLLVLASWRPVVSLYARPLEARYPALDGAALNRIALNADRPLVVVLGGGLRPDAGVPVSSWLPGAPLARVIEGVRLYRQLPGSRLLLTGGPRAAGRTEADSMRAVVLSLGVPATDILLDNASRDTASQALAVRRLAAGRPIVLVTSALHMPRAMALFRDAGLAPVPAPTDFRAGAARGTIAYWMPSGDALQVSLLAEHEWLGLLARRWMRRSR